jgi:hypothetical protein
MTRSGLEARLRALEDALRAVHVEAEHALAQPEIYFLTMCRIACLARRAFEGEAPPEPVPRETLPAPDET